MDIRVAMESFDRDCLSDAAAFVDAKLDHLEQRARGSADPDSDGIFDRGEYLAGLGLVACQAYLTESIAWSSKSKLAALQLGPRHECGHSIAALVNALANYWKHSPEWGHDLPPRAALTVDLIAGLGVDVGASYVVVNSLAELVRPRQPRIRHLLPFLAQWSEALRSDA